MLALALWFEASWMQNSSTPGEIAARTASGRTANDPYALEGACRQKSMASRYAHFWGREYARSRALGGSTRTPGALKHAEPRRPRKRRWKRAESSGGVEGRSSSAKCHRVSLRRNGARNPHVRRPSACHKSAHREKVAASDVGKAAPSEGREAEAHPPSAAAPRNGLTMTGWNTG